MNRPALLLLAALLFLGESGAARALTVIPRSFDELVARADTVFKGEVVAEASLWVGVGETRHIATRVTFRVDDTYKGQAAAQQTLEFIGGTVDDTTLAIPGMPRFEVGQAAVLFVVGNGVQFCPLVGVTQGRYHVVKDESTGREQIFTDDHLPVARTADLGRIDEAGVASTQRSAAAGATAMSVDDFKSEIVRKVAGLGK